MSDYKKALSYALFLLKFRQRSRYEIFSRLKRKGYNEDIIKKVLDYLENYNYINDEEFVKNYVDDLIKRGFGRRNILFKLKKLGISQNILENIKLENYKDKLTSLIDRKINQYKGKKNIHSKILRYFLSRGFEYEEIIEELNKKGLYYEDS